MKNQASFLEQIMRKILVASLLGLLSTSALSENWKMINASYQNGGKLVYIDKDSIRKNGKYTELWEKIEFINDKDGLDKILGLIIYDCPNKRFGALNAISYYKDGRIEGNEDLNVSNVKWSAPPPGTLNEAVYSAVCKNIWPSINEEKMKEFVSV